MLPLTWEFSAGFPMLNGSPLQYQGLRQTWIHHTTFGRGLNFFETTATCLLVSVKETQKLIPELEKKFYIHCLRFEKLYIHCLGFEPTIITLLCTAGLHLFKIDLWTLHRLISTSVVCLTPTWDQWTRDNITTVYCWSTSLQNLLMNPS